MIDIALAYLGRSPVALQALLYTCAGLLIAVITLWTVVTVQSSRLDAAQARQESLGDKLAVQNRAVRTWRAEADKQAQRVLTAQAAAEKVRTVTVERVREVTVAAIPQSCPESDGWLINWGLQFNARWEAAQ